MRAVIVVAPVVLLCVTLLLLELTVLLSLLDDLMLLLGRRLGRHLGKLSSLIRIGGVLLCLSLVLSLLQALLKSLFLQDPIVHEIEIEPFSHKGLSEHRNHLLIVRAFLKFQLS